MKDEQLNLKEEAKRWPWYKTWVKALSFPTSETAQEIMTQANTSVWQAMIWTGMVALLYNLINNLYQLLSNSVPISFNIVTTYIGNSLLYVLISLLLSFIIPGITHSIVRLKRNGSFVEYYVLFTAFSVPFSALFSAITLLQRITGFELFNLVIFVLSFLWVFAIGVIPARAYYRLGRWGAFLVSGVIPFGLLFSCYFLFFVLNPGFLQK
jgi:hypothetical protein